MDLSILKEFIALAKSRSFRETADEFFITRAALSNHMRSLENEVGFPLFNRAKANELTPEGATFFGLISTPVYQISEAIMQCGSLVQDGQAGKINASSVRISSCMWHSRVASALKKAHLSATFVPIDYKEPLLAPFERGDLDIMLNYSLRPFPDYVTDMERLGLECYPIGVHPLSVAMKSNHRLAAKKQLSRRDFDGETIFLTDGLRQMHWRWIISKALGEDVHVDFKFINTDQRDDIRFIDLEDALCITSREFIWETFGDRDEFVIRDVIDGQDLCFVRDLVAVYDPKKPQVKEAVDALLAWRDSQDISYPPWAYEQDLV